jgi:hypothetical protein
MPVGKREASLHVPRGQFERCRQQNTGSSNWRWRGCLFRAGLSPGPSLAEGGNPITHRSTINPCCVERFRNRRRTVRKDVRTQKRSRRRSSATAGAIRSRPHARRCQFPSSARARRALGAFGHNTRGSPPHLALCRACPCTSHSSRSVDSLASHRQSDANRIDHS